MLRSLICLAIVLPTAAPLLNYWEELSGSPLLGLVITSVYGVGIGMLASVAISKLTEHRYED